MEKAKRFGVALSGGGYRAAGFHLGTLGRLHELGLLDKVDVLSTISGGSIVGAAYCLHKGTYANFENQMIEKLSMKSVIGYVLKSWNFLLLFTAAIIAVLGTAALLFSAYAPLALLPVPVLIILLLKYQFRLFPISSIIESAYKEYFFGNATLSDLCSKPEIAIGSTNLHSGRQFTFSKRKMEDSYYAYLADPVKFNGEKFPLARAVVASSCVPFAFSPVEILEEYYLDPKQASTVKPLLIDGGVYDNQGIHKISQANSSYACDILLVSDAGSNIVLEGSYNNTITLLLRTVNLFMGRIKNFQMMQNLYQKATIKEIAYQSLGWEVESCVTGFYDNLVQGNIPKHTLKLHDIPEEYLVNPKDFRTEILEILNKISHVEELGERGLSKDKVEIIRGIGTNLTPIKKELILDMIKYCGNLTEIQLRLYCPSLFESRF